MEHISAEFEDFCKYAIEYITSEPFHPGLKGQGERFVDTFKKSF